MLNGEDEDEGTIDFWFSFCQHEKSTSKILNRDSLDKTLH